MKYKNGQIKLEYGEYLVTPDHPDAIKYTVQLDGHEIHDVVGLVRVDVEEIRKNEKVRSNLDG